MSLFLKDKARVRTILFFVVAAVAFALPVFSQQVDTAWVRRYNGPGNGDDKAVAIAVDSSGNVYVAGASFGGTTGFDYYTIKYLPNGDTAWVRRYNGPANDTDLARAMVLDEEGNVYVTGVSHGSITSVKYDFNGNLLWVDSLPTIDNLNRVSISGGYALGLDKQRNLYVTGQQWNADSLSWYVIKYDSLGNRQWLRLAAVGRRTTFGIAVDTFGNSYVFGGNEIFKFTTQGSRVWAQSYTTGLIRAIALDSMGNVYVTGDKGGIVTIKYDSLGNQLWVGEFRSPLGGPIEGGYSLAVDKNNNVYVNGSIWDLLMPNIGYGPVWIALKYDSRGNGLWTKFVADWFYSPSSTIVDSSGNAYFANDAYIVKYGPEGNELYYKILRGAVSSVAIDVRGNVYAAGVVYNWPNPDYSITVKYSPLPALKGDLSLDGVLDLNDVVFALNRTFLGIAPPAAPSACDLNCDRKITPADVVILLNMVFLSASAPC